MKLATSKGRTPLLLAVTEDRLAVARLLVYLGADPDALDDQHDTPWLVTGVTGSVDMLEVLLPAGPDLTIRNRFGGTSLIPASERGHVAYVRRAVSTDIEVNHVNNLGWTALLEAVILGDGSRRYQQIVTTLLDAGADPKVADRQGVTALEHASGAATRSGANPAERLATGRLRSGAQQGPVPRTWPDDRSPQECHRSPRPARRPRSRCRC